VTDNIAYNMLSALYAIACRLSVRMSVRLSHTILISQKRLKLGLCNFHHTIAPSLWFLRVKCHPKIVTGSARTEALHKGGMGKTIAPWP